MTGQSPRWRHVRPGHDFDDLKSRNTPGALISLLQVLLFVTGFVLLRAAFDKQTWWWLAPSAVCIVMAAWLALRHRAAVDTIDEEADALLAGSEPVVLRRRFRYGWPVALTLMFAIFGFVAWLAHFAWPTPAIVLPLAAATAIAWIMMLRRARPLGFVSADALQFGGERIPWEEIADVRRDDTTGGYSRNLVVTFTTRRPPISIPIRGLTLDSSVIHQVIDARFDRVREARVRAAAEREAQRVRAHLAAHPEDREKMAVEFQEKFDRDMKEARDMIAGFDRRLAGLRASAHGDPRANRRAAWVLICLLAGAASIVFAIETEFFASAAWSRLGLWTSLGVGVAAGAWIIVKALPRIPPRSRIGGSVVVLAFIMTFTGFTGAIALPDLYTRLAGQPFEITGQGKRSQRCGARSCREYAVTPVFPSASAAHIRISREEFLRLGATREYRVTGRASWFGRHVDEVTPARSRGQARDARTDDPDP